MLSALAQWWRRRRDARDLARHAIGDALWQQVLDHHPFIARRPAPVRAELRRMTSLFLARKRFSGAGGLVVTDAMAVHIAAQACLPVLRLGLDAYDHFLGIVVHPGAVRAAREWADEDGVVHQWEEELVGEAMPGGPLMLAWSEVTGAANDDATTSGAYNVVIHEFAHALDMRSGDADGIPPMPREGRGAWAAGLAAAGAAFTARLDAGEPSCIDPYGEEGPDEFFAVSAEAFFTTPEALAAEQPAWYGLLATYFGQDPVRG